MRSWLIGTVPIFIFLLQAPAAWLAHFTNEKCVSQCRLARVSGPWWAGQGELFVKSPSNGNWNLIGDINWRLTRPFGLEVHLGGGTARLDLGLSGVQLMLDRIVLPADIVLSQKVLVLPTASWDGSLHLLKTTAAWDMRGSSQATGHVVWKNVTSSMVSNYPLGNIELGWDWKGGQGLSGKVANSPNDAFTLSGDLQTGPQFNNVSFDGMVDLAPGSRARLSKYLSLVAKPVSGTEGRYRIKYPQR